MTTRKLLRRARELLRRHDVGTVGIVMVLAVAAGLIQNPLDIVLKLAGEEAHAGGSRWALWSGPLARYPDDVLAILLVIAALFRPKSMRLLPVIGIGIWMLAMLIGVAHALIGGGEPTATVIDLFRQVAYPAMLILVGVTLTFGERKLLVWTVVLAASVNFLYATLEFFGLRIFDPVILANDIGRWINPHTGLPGNFMGRGLDGSRVERVGGLLVSPPLLGIVMGFAAALAFWTVQNRILRYSASVLFIATTVATFGRAGLLMLAAAFLVPLLFRVAGRILGTLLAVAIAISTYLYLTSGGQRGLAHIRGAIYGVEDALKNPLGRGFGFIGNFAHDPRAGESLAGIGLSAGGWLALVALTALVVALLADLWKSRGRRWESAVSIGVVGCALLSESAGTLAGSIPLWLFIGMTLKSMPRYFAHSKSSRRQPEPALKVA